MIARSASAVLVLSVLLFCLGCAAAKSSGQSSGPETMVNVYEPDTHEWANADKADKKHVYMYFPSHGIYYDAGRGLYFLFKDGKWQKTIYVPAGVSAGLNEYKSIAMDTDEPYVYHDEVKKKYP